MGDVGRHLPDHREALGRHQPPLILGEGGGHRIDGGRQRAELVPTEHRDAMAEIAGADHPGRAAEGLDGTYEPHPDGGEVRHHAAQHEGDDPDEEPGREVGDEPGALAQSLHLGLVIALQPHHGIAHRARMPRFPRSADGSPQGVDQIGFLQGLRVVAERAKRGGGPRAGGEGDGLGAGRTPLQRAFQAEVLLVDEGQVVGEELPALHRPEGPDRRQEGHLQRPEEHQRELGAERHSRHPVSSGEGPTGGAKRRKATPSSSGRRRSGPTSTAGEIGRCRSG